MKDPNTTFMGVGVITKEVPSQRIPTLFNIHGSVLPSRKPQLRPGVAPSSFHPLIVTRDSLAEVMQIVPVPETDDCERLKSGGAQRLEGFGGGEICEGARDQRLPDEEFIAGLCRGDDVERETDQLGAVLDYLINVCGDDGVKFSEGLSAHRDFDANVLNHVQMRLQDCRLAKDAFNLGGEVEGSAGVENSKRFGMD